MLNPSTVLVAELSSEPLQKRTGISGGALAGINKLDDGKMFRVLAYRIVEGVTPASYTYHTHKDYTVGKKGEPLMLDNSKETQLCYRRYQSVRHLVILPRKQAQCCPILPAFGKINDNKMSTKSFEIPLNGGETQLLEEIPFKLVPGTRKNLTLRFENCMLRLASDGATNAEARTFMCHNLGADTSKGPFSSSADIHGDKYQWGRNKHCPYQKEDRTLQSRMVELYDQQYGICTKEPLGTWVSGSYDAGVLFMIDRPETKRWEYLSPEAGERQAYMAGYIQG
ncbi:hypothetical protein FQR65_LT15088 [Abscondita terminalis]|nr:hypothetical protein FQR65_LT15088 [Abscondita terminalis]